MKTRPKVYPPTRGWLDDDDENDGDDDDNDGDNDDDDNGVDDCDDDYEDIKLTSCCLWVEGRRDRWRWLTDTARCILLLIFSLFSFFHFISEKENTEWQTQLSVFWSPFCNFLNFSILFFKKKNWMTDPALCILLPIFQFFHLPFFLKEEKLSDRHAVFCSYFFLIFYLFSNIRCLDFFTKWKLHEKCLWSW